MAAATAKVPVADGACGNAGNIINEDIGGAAIVFDDDDRGEQEGMGWLDNDEAASAAIKDAGRGALDANEDAYEEEEEEEVPTRFGVAAVAITAAAAVAKAAVATALFAGLVVSDGTSDVVAVSLSEEAEAGSVDREEALEEDVDVVDPT